MNQQMISEAFDLMGKEGWDGLEPAQDAMRKAQLETREKMADEAAIVSAFIDTPAGQKFFRWLLSYTIYRGPNDKELGAKTAEEYAIAKAERTGQNQIAFMILSAMEVARMAGKKKGVEDAD